ncbi:MAG: ROK family protein [Dehalococcoidia bacterium]|jgi:glucokinase|nr:ROK family protein [Dehalococcoidia bacterium]
MTSEPVLVAVDFTAHTLQLLMAERGGGPLRREEWPLPELADDEAWSWEVGGRIATMFVHEGEQRSALALAVAAPGTVDPVSGRLVHSSGQAAWDGLAVVESLRRHIDAPIVAEGRTVAALMGERWQGAAGGSGDALYVSLRGEPSAAMVAGGRPLRGGHGQAGALPAVPELSGDLSGGAAEQALEAVAGLLADATALLDPEVVVLDAEQPTLEQLVPLVQGVVDEVAPGPAVVASALGEQAALIGALLMAETVAHEGGVTS